MITFKVGILGTGYIAGQIADCLNSLSGFTPYAVASRDEARATAFAVTHQIEKNYGSYEELIADPDIELVYIATYNSSHAELAKKCIEAGKPCLVEKPFSYNIATTIEVLELAKEKDIFCGEALWTSYMPLTNMVYKMISENMIGTVRHISTSLGYDLHEKERIIKPELGGGAILDLGIYPLSFILNIMQSMPSNFAPAITKWNTGVDALDSIQLNFSNARTASVFVTMTYKSDNSMTIYGTTGRIEIDDIVCPTKLTFCSLNGEPAQVLQKPEKQESGYEYEFIAARDAIMTGKIETQVHGHNEIIAFARLIEAIRCAGGIAFPLPGEPTQEELEARFRKV
jgi:Predicted dehydrogenases and related proteins